MATRALLLLLVGSAAAFACGEPNSNDFGNGDGSAGEPPNEGGTAGSSQGGSTEGGSTQGGSTQGGSSGTGGSSQGGAGQGGSSEGGTTSGGTSAGGSAAGGSAGTDPTGGTGETGGTEQGGSSGVSGRGGGGGTGGTDCETTIANARAALQAAQICNPSIDGPKCTGSVEDLCGCVVPVDNPESEATKNYLRLREPAVECGVPCLAIPCPEPTTATCGFAGVQAIIGAASCGWLPR